ncbi:uncharacterized protein LOC127266229 [Andrographis paniculata]|uniref:uncharacterized protein LOC127266229 n=1 Tax=Andrographis paniculata TaxID=175694 RepID=UPI0021E76F6B|nr:uncharacterized protein LOC127266229 [Andrographis paniculata]
MGVTMRSWRPWPPPISKKFRVNLRVQSLEGGDQVKEAEKYALIVEIKWKGPKTAFKRNSKTNCTREEVWKKDNDSNIVTVEWNEEFQNELRLSGYKENAFDPWEIQFSVSNILNQGTKNKASVIGVAQLDLAKYAVKTDEQDIEIKLPLMVPNVVDKSCPVLNISLNFTEIGQESNEAIQSPIPTPTSTSPLASSAKEEISALKTRLSKVKIFSEYVTNRRSKKTCRERGSTEGISPVKSEEGEYSYSVGSDSAEEFDNGETDEVKRESDVRASFSYGTLAFANFAGVSSYSNAGGNDCEDWIYYSNRRTSDVCPFRVEVVSEEPSISSSKRSILPWRKRKQSFRSPKDKGEPLLKKEAYGEEGGDDIDFDRRQLSCDAAWRKAIGLDGLVSEFGDDSFAVGSWERKEITSRDGLMKIEMDVFFASIDQRNEKAAGESACTALVAVIADWLQNNLNLMPIKSQFDSLIRDGSMEWRTLCDNEDYMERFPDKHFDLETVLEARIRDLCVVPDKSFIGFFHPEEMGEGNFEFLHGAMSFDNIWDEISCPESFKTAPVFIVSWNDHFFVLKVEPEAYYIIDTLGERLHEGCNQAYILKFDKNTTIHKTAKTGSPSSEEKTARRSKEKVMKKIEGEEMVLCRGKESCKEYIKSFLAAIPIRELQNDIKKGRPMLTLLHHRLQIEFHYTMLQSPVATTSQLVEKTIPDDA